VTKCSSPFYRKAKNIEITVTVDSQAQSATPNEDAKAESAETYEDYEDTDPFGDYGSGSWMERFFNYYFG